MCNGFHAVKKVLPLIVCVISILRGFFFNAGVVFVYALFVVMVHFYDSLLWILLFLVFTVLRRYEGEKRKNDLAVVSRVIMFNETGTGRDVFDSVKEKKRSFLGFSGNFCLDEN